MNRNTWLGLILLALLAAVLATEYLKRMAIWIWPVKGRISSDFGPRTHPITGVASNHNGIDIAAPTGTPIVAPKSGRVISIYSTATGGLQMVVEHAGGWRSGYAHLSETIAKVGEDVMKGETIAKVGNTGASTGPHLHFTITSPNGKKVNPENLLA